MRAIDLKAMPRESLRRWIAQQGGKPYWGDYLFTFIHTRGVLSFEDVTPLPKTFRHRLEQVAVPLRVLDVVDRLRDPDGTWKFLFADPRGNSVETVVLDDRGRKTACVSCQMGCRMGCRFCATGQLPFQGHLNAGQIVEQVNALFQEGHAIHNVVYMGMGEPLDNLEAVLASVAILNDPKGHGIGQRHLTISTCGLPDGILELAETGLQVRLALSLHAPDDALRGELMPIARRFSLRDLFAALAAYQQQTGRRVTVEYALLAGVNDRPRHAKALLQRLRGLHVSVNLLEYNDYPGSPFQASDRTTLERFAEILRGGGVETVVRYRRGRAILAACGQLGAARLTRPGDA